MPKTVDQILSVAKKLRADYSARDKRYLANWYAFLGEYDKIAPSYYRNDGTDRRHGGMEAQIQVWNLIRPIVDTKRLLINRLPGIKVPAPVMGDPLAASKSEKQEKVLYALWDMGRMKRKHGEAAFNIGLNNASVWQVSWDTDKDIPIVYSRAPGECYPVMKRGGDEVSYCIFCWTQEVDQLVENYPDAKPLFGKQRGASLVEVYEYIDSTSRVLVVGGKAKSLLPEGGEHNLGICPVLITPGSCITGEIFPQGQVDQLVGINDYLNRFQTKLGDALEEVMFGRHILKGAGARNQAFNSGPGAVVRLDEDVEYQYDQPQPPPREAFALIDQVQAYMRDLGTWPSVASGQMDASVVTGKAVTRLQGVMSAMAAEAQDNIGDDVSRCNEIMLRMLQTYRPQKKYTLYSTEAITALSSPSRPTNFSVTIVPEEDIKGYYANQLIYSPFGTDTQASMMTGMQMVDNRVLSRRAFMNSIPFIGDAEGMQREIEEEDRSRMMLEVELQTSAKERLMQLESELQTKQMQAQAQMTQSGGGTGQPPAPNGEAAPPPQGGLPPSAPGQVGNTTLMPGGQPAMMGMGEPMTGNEDFPLPYTPLKPFGPAMAELAGTGVHGQAVDQAAAKGQSEAMPGRTVVKAEEVTAALKAAVNRQGVNATAKIKGKVYLMGEMATRGWSDGKIEIGITQKSDQQIIVTALPQWASQGLLSFRVIAEGTTPTDGVMIFGPEAKTAPNQEPVAVS
jgi:hypothetical protein